MQPNIRKDIQSKIGARVQARPIRSHHTQLLYVGFLRPTLRPSRQHSRRHHQRRRFGHRDPLRLRLPRLL